MSDEESTCTRTQILSRILSDQIKRKIIKLLIDDVSKPGPMYFSEICAKTGEHPLTIQEHLDELNKLGVLAGISYSSGTAFGISTDFLDIIDSHDSKTSKRKRINKTY